MNHGRINRVLGFLESNRPDLALKSVRLWHKRGEDFRARHKCDLCGGTERLESYMVKKHVWDEAMDGREGFLHLRCLERRLCRRLTIEDFTDAPINDMLRYGYGMLEDE